jgi:hypothetical protein
MATEMIRRDDEDRELVVPQQTAAAISDQRRAIAEAQAALMVAAGRPRDERAAVDRILTACQRPRLAELSQYSYSRGGTEITGPSIRLLETVAGCWGNLQYGFRELEQRIGESQVEAFAWDLESNTKAIRVFSVPHSMKARGGMKRLEDGRDIYEWVANQAQRRVRACLQEVIPRDVVEDATDECTKTLATKDPVTSEKITKLVAAFGGFGVTKEQIETRIQRRIDTLTPAQMVSLRRIYTSLKDGMSQPAEWFKQTEAEEPEKPATLKEKLKAKAKAAPEEDPTAREIESHGGDETRESLPETLQSDGDLTPEDRAAIAAEEAQQSAGEKRGKPKQQELMK